MSSGSRPPSQHTFADQTFAAAVTATLAESSRQGSLGDAADQWAFATPWEFDLASIHQPVEVWHGDADTVVPVVHARVLAAALENSNLRILPHDGHFSIGLRAVEQSALVAGVPGGAGQATG